MTDPAKLFAEDPLNLTRPRDSTPFDCTRDRSDRYGPIDIIFLGKSRAGCPSD